MKVKHIVSEYIDEFEELINEFIKDKDIVDIKYNNYAETGMLSVVKVYFSALIMYEDKEEI